MAIWAREDPLSGSDILRGITDRISVTRINADIPATNLSPKPIGQYIVTVYAMLTTADGAAGQVTLTVNYTDESGPNSIQVGTLSLSSPNFLSVQFVIRVSSGVPSFAAAVFGAYLTSRYTLIVTCQQL